MRNGGTGQLRTSRPEWNSERGPSKPRATLTMMSTIRARVRDGRLIVDEPTDLPEGTELDLVIDDAGDGLDEAERTALHAAIGQAWASFQAGEGRPAADVLRDLGKG